MTTEPIAIDRKVCVGAKGVAALLEVSEAVARGLMLRPDFPSKMVGNKRKASPDDVLDWYRKQPYANGNLSQVEEPVGGSKKAPERTAKELLRTNGRRSRGNGKRVHRPALELLAGSDSQ